VRLRARERTQLRSFDLRATKEVKRLLAIDGKGGMANCAAFVGRIGESGQIR
jgi:hypothetical protein